MKKLKLSAMALMLCFCAQSQTITPDWESIKTHPYPQWFSDAKLGIFIHWGLYSVPAYSGKEQYAEWFYKGLISNDTGRIEFMKKFYGKDFEYKDFEPLFKAELFNPAEWADLFEKSGAKYVLLVTKHHDGYCLWDSKYSPKWNSVNGGPKRNIVEELTNAVRKKGLEMGFYYSLPEWTNPLHRWTTDPDDSIENYVQKHMIPQFKELISKYKPTIIFTDGEWFNTAEQWHAKELISWYYNTVGSKAIVNDRWGSGSDYGFRTPEYSAGILQTDRPWAECRGLGRSFGLNRKEPIENYITSDELIKHFAKLVAAGGGLTLNVGPAADGKIPLLQQERLLDLGKWLKTNGEAIYKTKPFEKFYEYKDVEVRRTDKQINFDWVRNSPDPAITYDNFTAEWTGFISPKFSEKYTFEIEVDDGASVEINGKEIINFNPQKAKAAERNAQDVKNFKIMNGEIYLKEGKLYPIKIKYYEDNLEARIKLLWQSKSQKKQIIDTSAFYLDKTGKKNGLSATFKCKQPTVCYTKKGNALYAIVIDTFPQDKLILNVREPSRNAKIKMLGCGKTLTFDYKNGQLIIDTTPIKYNDIKSSAAWTFKIENF